MIADDFCKIHQNFLNFTLLQAIVCVDFSPHNGKVKKYFKQVKMKYSEIKPILTFDNSRRIFICKCRYEDRKIPYAAGFSFADPDEAFQFDNKKKMWYTPVPKVAFCLRDYADSLAKRELNRLFIKQTPFNGELLYNEDLILKEYQESAIRFALERNRSYLALDPGLGKTACALIVTFTLNRPFVYICPPSLKLNVEDEVHKWIDPLYTRLNYLIIPDSMLDRLETISMIKDFLYFNFNCILIVDEFHRYKNSEALRTLVMFGFEKGKTKNFNLTENFAGLVSTFDKIIVMSGTPMPNRPVELFPMLNKLAPDSIDFFDQHRYGVEYCNAKQTPFGWDYMGASNVKKLYEKITEKFMLRIKKKDVLKDLPPKIEELIFIGEDIKDKTITSMERQILKVHSPKDLLEDRIKKISGLNEDEELHLATYRRLLGLYKAKFALPFIRESLEDNAENFLIFGIHTDVIEYLYQNLKKYNPYVITGKTPRDKRVPIVKEFTKNKKSRLLIGNIQAAGLGLNIVKASRVIKVEYSWCDKDNEQATDRAHRIGQTQRVLDQYLVFKNSLDRAVLEVIFNKRRIEL